MQSVATFGVSSRQGYQIYQCPQLIENGGWDSVNVWGYEGHNQSRNKLVFQHLQFRLERSVKFYVEGTSTSLTRRILAAI